MGTWVAVAVLVASSGEVSAAQDVQDQRAATRFHAAVGLVGTLGVGGFVGGGGPGVTGELGVTLADRSTVAVRLSVGSLPYLAAASAGVSWDYALSERWSLGTGAMLGYLGGFIAEDLPSAILVQVPLRAQFAFWERDARRVSRSGLRLVLEAGPGVVLAGTRGFVPGGATRPLERWAAMGAVGLVWAF